MISHLSLKFRTDSEGLQQQETLDALPKAIRSSISHHLFFSLVQNVYLFQGVSNDLIFHLVSEMNAEYFAPREDVVLQNEAPSDFYIVVTGIVELIELHSGAEQLAGLANAGDVVGEIGVLCYRPQLFTVRTRSLCQLLRLNRASFLRIIQSNLGDGTIVMNNLIQYLKEKKDSNVITGVRNEIEQMLARGQLNLPMTVCFAASKGDDMLLHQLLKRGLDPNELDTYGHSALHIAASTGSEQCVRLLLENGADPNARDPEGRVPLWEAVRRRHSSAVQQLVQAGADLSSGEAASYARVAVEEDDAALLEEIVRHGGDVAAACGKDGATPLHLAVLAGKAQMVRVLLENGADADREDGNGVTARAMADRLSHRDVLQLLLASRHEAAQKPPRRSSAADPPDAREKTALMARSPHRDSVDTSSSASSSRHGRSSCSSTRSTHQQRMASFRNSLFGVISASNAHGQDGCGGAAAGDTGVLYRGAGGGLSCRGERDGGGSLVRVTVSCPEQAGSDRRLVFMPETMRQLLELGRSKFGFTPTKVVTSDGAVVDDVRLVRDGDNLLLVSDQWPPQS